jgi:hypothetical protein
LILLQHGEPLPVLLGGDVAQGIALAKNDRGPANRPTADHRLDRTANATNATTAPPNKAKARNQGPGP